MDFAQMAELCAPGVGADTLSKIASVESSFNPYAIGVVGGRLQRQPRNISEALSTVRMLQGQGYDYSVGLVQINKKNFAIYGLTHDSAFDPCINLRVGSLILKDCLKRAGGSDHALGDALSCYYSGNFTAGYRLGYVAKVQNADAHRPDFPVTQAIPLAAKESTSIALKGHRRATKAPEPIFVNADAATLTPPPPEQGRTPTPSLKNTALLF